MNIFHSGNNKHNNFNRLMACIFFLLASAPSLARTMVYISNADDGEIAVYELNKNNGELSAQQTIAAGESVMPLSVSPNKHRLYAAIRATPHAVASFSINQRTGQLERLSQANLANSSSFIQTDATGKYLLSSSYGGSSITINHINASGEVISENAKTYPTGLKAHAVLMDSTNRFLFVTNLGSDQVLQMIFDVRTGEAKPNESAIMKTQAGAGPRHLRFSPDNKFMYVLNEHDGTVNVYAFDKKTGTLLEKQSILMAANAFTEKPSAAEIQITPNGRYVYTSERRTNTLSLFKRNPKTGMLTYVKSTETENKPRSFAITPDGRHLLAAGQKSSHVSVYKIEKKTGQLTFLQRYAVGKNPSWVEIVELR